MSSPKTAHHTTHHGAHHKAAASASPATVDLLVSAPSNFLYIQAPAVLHNHTEPQLFGGVGHNNTDSSNANHSTLKKQSKNSSKKQRNNNNNEDGGQAHDASPTFYISNAGKPYAAQSKLLPSAEERSRTCQRMSDHIQHVLRRAHVTNANTLSETTTTITTNSTTTKASASTTSPTATRASDFTLKKNPLHIVTLGDVVMWCEDVLKQQSDDNNTKKNGGGSGRVESQGGSSTKKVATAAVPRVFISATAAVRNPNRRDFSVDLARKLVKFEQDEGAAHDHDKTTEEQRTNSQKSGEAVVKQPVDASSSSPPATRVLSLPPSLSIKCCPFDADSRRVELPPIMLSYEAIRDQLFPTAPTAAVTAAAPISLSHPTGHHQSDENVKNTNCHNNNTSLPLPTVAESAANSDNSNDDDGITDRVNRPALTHQQQQQHIMVTPMKQQGIWRNDTGATTTTNTDKGGVSNHDDQTRRNTIGGGAASEGVGSKSSSHNMPPHNSNGATANTSYTLALARTMPVAGRQRGFGEDREKKEDEHNRSYSHSHQHTATATTAMAASTGAAAPRAMTSDGNNGGNHNNTFVLLGPSHPHYAGASALKKRFWGLGVATSSATSSPNHHQHQPPPMYSHDGINDTTEHDDGVVRRLPLLSAVADEQHSAGQTKQKADKDGEKKEEKRTALQPATTTAASVPTTASPPISSASAPPPPPHWSADPTTTLAAFIAAVIPKHIAPPTLMVGAAHPATAAAAHQQLDWFVQLSIVL